MQDATQFCSHLNAVRVVGVLQHGKFGAEGDRIRRCVLAVGKLPAVLLQRHLLKTNVRHGIDNLHVIQADSLSQVHKNSIGWAPNMTKTRQEQKGRMVFD